MQIKIISIGKVKNKNIANEISEIIKRLGRVDIVELKEVKDSNSQIVKKKEFALFEKHISSFNFNVLLIENGTEFSTKEFYEKYKDETRVICFFITGAFGPCDE